MKTQATRQVLVPSLFLASSFAACGSPPQAESPPPPPPPVAVAPVTVTTASAAAPAPTSIATSAPAPSAPDLVIVSVTNAAGVGRKKETIALAEAELKKVAPAFELGKALVFDASGAPVLSQLVATTAGAAPSELVFQADFIAGETKSFRVRL